MLKLLFMVDTEIWCGGWNDLNGRFPDAFKRYAYGPTSAGDYALPGLFRILDQHGLKGVFMVESLFATRFGEAPLAELVGLIRESGHEIQRHLHPEWVDEASEPLLANRRDKTQHLSAFSLDEQETLVRRGRAASRCLSCRLLCTQH